MTTYDTIGFIGAGNLGGALGRRLAAAGQTVQYWDVDKSLATAPSLDDLAQTSNLILICTPSQTNRLLAREIAQAVGEGPAPTVISLAKGIEASFITVDQVLAAELGDRYVTGVISGPMLASEIAEGGISGAVVATTDARATETIAQLINQAGIITETSTDPTGVARCGALKNVYALVLGLADGLELSYNTKSILTTMIIAEFRRVLEHLGSSTDLTFTLAGLGDLLTTGWSGASFNWQVGKQRGQGATSAKGEGFNTLRQLPDILPIQRYTILHTAWSIFCNDAEPDTLKTILTTLTLKNR